MKATREPEACANFYSFLGSALSSTAKHLFLLSYRREEINAPQDDCHNISSAYKQEKMPSFFRFYKYKN